MIDADQVAVYASVCIPRTRAPVRRVKTRREVPQAPDTGGDFYAGIEWHCDILCITALDFPQYQEAVRAARRDPLVGDGQGRRDRTGQGESQSRNRNSVLAGTSRMPLESKPSPLLVHLWALNVEARFALRSPSTSAALIKGFPRSHHAHCRECQRPSRRARTRA